MADPNGYIQTYTGLKFWPLEPNIEAICIEDIAHALSQNCRWTGHCKDFYSVAQHCVYASENVPEQHALTALLHDASEAYLSDLSRPVKHSPQLEGYRQAEARLEALMAVKFGITYPYPPEVKNADNRLLYTERRDVLGSRVDWSTDTKAALGIEGDSDRKPYDFTIVPWTCKEAEQRFLKRFYELNGQA